MHTLYTCSFRVACMHDKQEEEEEERRKEDEQNGNFHVWFS